MHVARAALLALVLLAAGCGGGGEQAATTEAASSNGQCRTVEQPAPKPDGGSEAPAAGLDAAKTYRLVVQTSCGDFTIELDQRSAPKTAASLVALAENGFFDGTTFHRVVPGFVIQGGDPTGTGTGGPGYSTLDVPSGAEKYTQGVVAMAKTATEPPGTAGSQFFVVTGPDIGLPPQYAVVGRVTEGYETVAAIEGLGVGDGPPSMPVVLEKATVETS